MTIIKDGFGGQPLEITVDVSEGHSAAEVWIDTKVDPTRITATINANGEGNGVRQEYLHYATITELITLRDEINRAIKGLAGL